MPYNNNQVQLIGNAGAQPEIHLLTDDTPVTRLRLYLNVAGLRQGRDSFQLVAWNRMAERLSEQVNRGDRLLIQGQLRNRRFDHEGTTHLRTEVEVSAFFILSKKQVPSSIHATIQIHE